MQLSLVHQFPAMACPNVSCTTSPLYLITILQCINRLILFTGVRLVLLGPSYELDMHKCSWRFGSPVTRNMLSWLSPKALTEPSVHDVFYFYYFFSVILIYASMVVHTCTSMPQAVGTLQVTDVTIIILKMF